MLTASALAQVMTHAEATNFYVNPLSDQVRVATQKKQVYRQFARPEMNYGAHQGTAMRYVKVSNLREYGRRVAPMSQTPVTSLDTSTFEVTWDTWANSVAIEEHADLVSQLSPSSMLANALRDDAARTLDTVIAQPLVKCDFVYTPTGTYATKTATAVGTGVPVATQTRPFALWDLYKLVTYMKNQLGVPTYGNTNSYICVGGPDFVAGLVRDNEYTDFAKWARPKDLFSGEIGEPVFGTRFIEENNVLGSNEATLFGDDALVELEVEPLNIQLGDIGTYGEIKQLRWIWRGGVATPYRYSLEGITRVVRVASA